MTRENDDEEEEEEEGCCRSPFCSSLPSPSPSPVVAGTCEKNHTERRIRLEREHAPSLSYSWYQLVFQSSENERKAEDETNLIQMAIAHRHAHYRK